MIDESVEELLRQINELMARIDHLESMETSKWQDLSTTSGTSSVANGDTTKVVAHGLPGTPTVINIAFREQGDNDFGRWWVDTIGAANFTLNVSADPGASNLDFAWEAKVR